MKRTARDALAAGIAVALAAAFVGWMASRPAAAADAAPVAIPPPANAPPPPLGDVAGDPGQPPETRQTLAALAADPRAVGEGHRLFLAMNCASCHGYDGSGGMGPDLTDGYWRYGGSPIEVYLSIRDGRPQGMPAWGRTLPPELIRDLVAYIGTLASPQGHGKPDAGPRGRDAGGSEGQGLGRQKGQ